MPTDPTPADPHGPAGTSTRRVWYDTSGPPLSVVTTTYDADGRVVRREPPDGPGDSPPDEPHVVG